MTPTAARRTSLLVTTVLGAALSLTLSALGPGWSPEAHAAPAGTPHLPDLQTVLPLDSFSIVQTSGARELRYTHRIYNAGDGPLAITPFYRPSAGTYLGRQQLMTHDDSDTWTTSATRRVADAFEFHAEHGHFHFPLASFGLYAVAPGGGFGKAVAMSPKTGFCIADSGILDQPVEHNGVGAGWWGSCADPTTRRGISVGGFDEYDYRDPGQSVPIDGVPDGTYWFRAISDPADDFVETDESNNEEAVKLTIANGQVTTGAVRHPDTTPCTVSLLTPAEGDRVGGAVRLTARTGAGSRGVVRYLVDGRVVGSSRDATSSYAVTWAAGSVADGAHWLTARATQGDGRQCTGRVVAVDVRARSGPDTTGPRLRITDPAGGSTVAGRVALAATATDDSGVSAVRFLVDGVQVGRIRHAPPYTVTWNSRAVAAGAHRITVRATDKKGNASRASIRVRVRHIPPPQRIRVDVSVVAHGTGAIVSPPVTTSTRRSVVVALVSYDGPADSRQSATVSGGGLSWHLVKRSNGEAGDSEIWAARVSHRLHRLHVHAAARATGYDGMLSVLALRNARGVGVAAAAGAPTGVPDFYVPGVQEGSWVFAAGNDWDGAVAREPASGQRLVRQWLDTAAGDTFWVQSTKRPTTSGRLVTIDDSAPTGDRWNYVGVEVVARH